MALTSRYQTEWFEILGHVRLLSWSWLQQELVGNGAQSERLKCLILLSGADVMTL
jgi:hypothetical protein